MLLPYALFRTLPALLGPVFGGNALSVHMQHHRVGFLFLLARMDTAGLHRAGILLLFALAVSTGFTDLVSVFHLRLAGHRHRLVGGHWLWLLPHRKRRETIKRNHLRDRRWDNHLA